MPRHDPIPPRAAAAGARAAAERRRFKQLMGWMALASLVAALLALMWLKSFGDPVPIHMQIATFLGVGLTMLVGTGLMGLVFLSNRSGHDQDVTDSTRGGAGGGDGPAR
jgi:hypothetical protein